MSFLSRTYKLGPFKLSLSWDTPGSSTTPVLNEAPPEQTNTATSSIPGDETTGFPSPPDKESATPPTRAAEKVDTTDFQAQPASPPPINRKRRSPPPRKSDHAKMPKAAKRAKPQTTSTKQLTHPKRKNGGDTSPPPPTLPDKKQTPAYQHHGLPTGSARRERQFEAQVRRITKAIQRKQHKQGSR